MTKVYKIRDPKTGEFYTGDMYKSNPTTKQGRVYNSISTVKAFLTRFGYDSRVNVLLNDNDMEIVEYDLVEVSSTKLSNFKR